MRHLFIYSFIIVAISCACSRTENTLTTGPWLFQLQLDVDNKLIVLPVNAYANSQNIVFRNDEERISVSEIEYYNDSVKITMPVFGSEFIGEINSDSISGYYHNYNKGVVYKIPFVSYYSRTERFEIEAEPEANISGKWDAWFLNPEGDSILTIASFKQTGNIVRGTFFTEIGDYRYLEGVMDGNQLKLSTFDGGHAFLFLADLSGDDNLEGTFRSGHQFKQNWYATRNENSSLRGMKELTYLKEGYEKFEFSFPDTSGNLVSLEDEVYQDKVVIVQIFGTWCPNCMDETRYLVDLYKKYHHQGLEIIGLDFEIEPELEYFKTRVKRFRRDLKVPYNIVLAGSSIKELAAEALPMLNHILSYPTAIIIDRAGEIQEIHTGFSGPGTGKAYLSYKEEMETLIESLL